ncbi:histidinol-phosphate transaminase [Psychromicrobium xiongbiense]|uniref:histidinol-phosphate transaminase n=1 Tax=Psychromicrobium xiongbiense TaxID=3051184 RepID=UPI00255228AD|nr:histidinol-phosphate transaminase [Psychromicrobium sp. YIM S02556]
MSTESAEVSGRSALGRLPRYAAGKPPVAVAGLTSFKLSSNENPLSPLPEVLAAIASHPELNRYPEATAAPLREALSDFLGVPAEDVVVGGGSLGAFNQILAAFAGANDGGQPDEVIFAWRSFEAYPISVGLAGAKSVMVPLDDQARHDLDAMAAAVTEQTRVIVLCTPNNPTGPVLRTAEVEAFLAKVPNDVVVVIDEAYVEFVTESDAVQGLGLYRTHPNVVVLRTFSKAYGLAGLRVGYSVSHPELTQYLRVAAVPFAASTVAQYAAIESLHRHDQIVERVQGLVSERERVLASLRSSGWWIPESQGNFLWLALGVHSPEFAALAESRGLSVRAFGQEGVRISIGEVEGNSRLLEICAQWPEAQRPVPAL